MGLLMRCSQCGVYAAPGHSCPIEHGGPVAVDERATELVAEYRRRQQQHRINYAKYMILVFAWVGVTVVLQARAFIIARHWFPVETVVSLYATPVEQYVLMIASDLFLGAAWLLLGAAVGRCRAWWPIEVECPRCDSRLDEIGMKLTHCPGCQVWLGTEDVATD